MAIGLTVPGFLLVAVALWWSIPSGNATDSTAIEPAADGGEVVGTGVPAIRTAIANRGVILAVIAATLMLFAFQG